MRYFLITVSEPMYERIHFVGIVDAEMEKFNIHPLFKRWKRVLKLEYNCCPEYHFHKGFRTLQEAIAAKDKLEQELEDRDSAI